MVDTDRITGAAKELGGKVQGAVGDLTGSQRDSAEGRAREAAGKAENLYGQAKDTVRDAAETVADTARDLGGRIRETVGGLVGSDDIEHRARQPRVRPRTISTGPDARCGARRTMPPTTPGTPTTAAPAPCARAA